MPEITRFYGIIIKMFFKPKEHEPSHIHALYGEYVGIFDIKTKKITTTLIGVGMIPRIKKIEPRPEFKLYIEFDEGQKVIYDLKEDIDNISEFSILLTEHGLYENVQLDESRTCIFWNDRIDLPSDTLLEYGKKV